MLYQIGVQKEPLPQLVKLASADLAERVVAGPVIAGPTVYVVTRDGMLRAYELGVLKPAGEWRLPSRHIPWIRPAGDLVLLATGDELVGCNASEKKFGKLPRPAARRAATQSSPRTALLSSVPAASFRGWLPIPVRSWPRSKSAKPSVVDRNWWATTWLCSRPTAVF